MKNDNYIFSEITDKIISEAYKVHRKLGRGFMEKVYENALVKCLRDTGFSVEQQFPIKVFFEDVIVGDYYADIFVDGKVIIELKAIESLGQIHEVQLVNYLKATNIQVGLLFNFGKKLEIKRRVFSGIHNDS